MTEEAQLTIYFNCLQELFVCYAPPAYLQPEMKSFLGRKENESKQAVLLYSRHWSMPFFFFLFPPTHVQYNCICQGSRQLFDLRHCKNESRISLRFCFFLFFYCLFICFLFSCNFPRFIQFFGVF